jgi:hypothetical protein
VVFGGQLGKTVGRFPVLNEDPVFISAGFRFSHAEYFILQRLQWIQRYSL